ncbi:unnamed protein product [Rhizoctonia solani]|uniref:Protein-S-isoprenylcysteine O-methyltransferase n=1 Tax=Rhizoctonia solani TaxID=456999 RepID=A0A8H3D4Z9_9AGAM|nr:unnamed protein product [Rhizoctonia solani]
MFNDTQTFVETTDAVVHMTPAVAASALLLTTAAYYAHTFIQMPNRKVNDQTSCLGLFATVIGRDFAALQILFELYALLAPCFALPYLPSSRFSYLSPRAVLGALTLIAGGALRAYAHHTMGKNYLFDLRIGQSHSLVTCWVLLFSPGSNGAFMRTWPALAFGCWVTVALGGTVLFGYVASRAKSEDEMLRGHFGKEWDRWAEKTKYRVVPGVY